MVAPKEEDKIKYKLSGMFMDIKPAHPSEPPKFAMKLLNEQFDE